MPVTLIGYQLECCYNSSPKLPGVYLMLVTLIRYQLECCYNSSPKLPGVNIHTVRASIHDINLLLTVT